MSAEEVKSGIGKLPSEPADTQPSKEPSVVAAQQPAASAPQKSSAAEQDEFHDAEEGGCCTSCSHRTKASVRLLFIVVHFIAFTGLNSYEIYNDFLVNYKLNDEPFKRRTDVYIAGNEQPDPEVKFMWFVIAFHIAFLICFALLDIFVLMQRQILALRNAARPQRTCYRKLLWLTIILIMGLDWIKIWVNASMLNKLRYQGTWCVSEDPNYDIKYLFDPSSQPGLTCTLSPAGIRIKRSIIFAMASVILCTFTIFIKEVHGWLTKIMSLVGCCFLSLLLFIKPVTSMLMLHYTQRHYTAKGNFDYESEEVVAVISMVLCTFLSVMIAWVIIDLKLFMVFCNAILRPCGWHYERAEYKLPEHRRNKSIKSAVVPAATADSTKAAPSCCIFGSPVKGEDKTKEFTDVGSVTAGEKDGVTSPPGAVTIEMPTETAPEKDKKKKVLGIAKAMRIMVSQFYYIGQLPVVFGLLAPILTISSLAEYNFWIGWDLVFGAIYVVAYIILFLIHKYCYPQF